MKNASRTDEVPDSKLWATLYCAGFAISRIRELELAQFGLTLEQSSTLHILIDHGGSITIKEIIDETMRQPNSVYTLLNRMEKMGLISNSRKKEGGNTLFTITEKGRSALKKITVISLNEIFSVLQAKDKVKFMELLAILLNRARDLLGVEYVPPIMKFLNSEIPDKPKPKYFIADDGLPSNTTLWSILNGTRFAISRLRELELAKFGLTLEQSLMLGIMLDHSGVITMKEITDETMRQPNSAYTLLNRMEKMGLVSNTRKKEGGSTLFTITEDGEKLLKEITTISLNIVFSSLAAKEKVKLINLLTAITDKARNLLGIPYSPPIVHLLAGTKNLPATKKQNLTGGRGKKPGTSR